ncbi:hypothetical protein TSUD_132240 [Trifolium subterraneum]|uniref:Neprosin PEP catalytic domain-containing protein n=1 Tax=Trifolium subterraneum TaxID=3900 RepID=A0A2Z6LGV7_TRISU|nr:hypothetical protein TSUD_132240 [Trifolium subterraneum]
MSSFDQAAWVGITSSHVGTSSPPMGSGQRPNDNLNEAAYFKNLDFVDDSRKNQQLPIDSAPIFTSTPCYGAQYIDRSGIGLTLQFGGPGGKCGV